MKKVLILIVCLSVIAACGGGNGGGSAIGSASGGEGGGTTALNSTIVTGMFVAPQRAAIAGLVQNAAVDPIMVTVQEEPTITTKVGDDGTFTLRGLPAGSFTLLFTQGSSAVGTLVFKEVAANQQITISVQMLDGEVVLVDQDRRGIGNAGIELEGTIESLLPVDAAGEGKFVLNGRTVIVRPGVTAIRQGAERKAFADLKVGMRVHVKGAKVEESTDVLAYEVIIQNAGATTTTTLTGGEEAEKKISICHVPGGNRSKGKTITIGASAWPAHEAHGDTEGPCAP